MQWGQVSSGLGAEDAAVGCLAGLASVLFDTY